MIRYRRDYIDAGELDERITLQKPITSKDGFGDVTPTWTDVVNGGVWAKRRETRATETFEEDRLVAKTITEFTIRYRPDVNPTYRVVDADGKVYEIHGIQRVGRRRWLKLTTEVRSA